jgi:hypothetical protein
MDGEMTGLNALDVLLAGKKERVDRRMIWKIGLESWNKAVHSRMS